MTSSAAWIASIIRPMLGSWLGAILTHTVADWPSNVLRVNSSP